MKNLFFKSSAMKALRRHISRDFNKVFSSVSSKILPSFKACVATVKAGASSSQISPEEPSAVSTASTGPAPSSAHSSNPRAANAPASPPGTSVPVTPYTSSLSGQHPRVDVIERRASSTQSEPAPTAPLPTTTDLGTSSRRRIIDLDAASSEELEEEEEKDVTWSMARSKLCTLKKI